MHTTQTGILNPSVPGTRRAISTFPNVLSLPGGRLLATYRVGSTKDCDDEIVELRESADLGLTWSEPRTPFPAFVQNGVQYSLKLVYLTLLPGGEVLAASMVVDRTSHPGKPLFNDSTQGCLPMRILISKSTDVGVTWAEWNLVDTPEDVGPPSLTSPALLLHDGRLALSIESNKTYLDSSQWLQKVVYLYSSDGGRTWGNPAVVAQDPTGQIFNWDQRAGVAPDGAVVTFTWVFDSVAGVYRNIWRRDSTDGGSSWTEPEDLGFPDQAGCPAVFEDGRMVLAWVDRFGMEAIRARLSVTYRDPFQADTEVVLYQNPQRSGPAGIGLSNTLDDMGRWSYGLPFAHALPNGEALVVYYAGSATGTSIHWARLALA
jgi:hypothetical protein